MLFISILSLTTLSIAVVAEYFSIYGLANMFAAYFWSVVCMGVVLAAGKFVAVSYLYRYWEQTGVMLRSYLLVAVFLLMLNTSMGIFGYLSAGYQSDTAPLKQAQQQITLLESELGDLQARKRDIDSQISQLAVGDVRGKQRLDRMFYQETRVINKRIPELTAQVQQLKMKNLEIEAHVGPIIYIADAFGLSTDNATKYIILLLIFVFEPLAVVLSICLNVVIGNRGKTVVTEHVTASVEPVVPDTHQDRSPFTDIAFDLVSNRQVEAPQMATVAADVPDQVPAPTVAPQSSQPPIELELVPIEQLTPEHEPVAEQPSSVEVEPEPEPKLIEHEEPIVQDEPPKREIPRDSILDRWLKQRQQ